MSPNAGSPAQSDPLPSWNNGASKQAIIEYVAKVTHEGGPDFMRPEERIATFDNDGTLWCEQPVPVQFAFALDRLKALASAHPEWKETQPFKAALEGDLKTLAQSGERGLVDVVGATHAGMTTEEFQRIVKDWFASARDLRFKCEYSAVVYQPMIELLTYLRANGFKTFIVSGGGIEFMYAFAERVYGIPPEQVVGSSCVTQFMMGPDGKPVLMREAKVDFVDDGSGKPVAIYRYIGRRPILAFGNSDGDLPMLQWTAAGAGARFMGLIHHTDAEREYAYERAVLGTLNKALDEAHAHGWTVVDMKRDWKRVFAFD